MMIPQQLASLDRIPAVLARLRKSKSGYVRVTKFGGPDRTAIMKLIEEDKVEIFRSPLGKAYRLTEKGRDRGGMKALTLWQPWASAVVFGPKRIENRPWKTELVLNKQFLIHAGKKYDRARAQAVRDLWPKSPGPKECPLGEIIGAARLIGTLQVHEPGRVELVSFAEEHLATCRAYEAKAYEPGDEWLFGPFGWILDSVVALPEPVPCRGLQKLWNVPAPELAKVRAQLDRMTT